MKALLDCRDELANITARAHLLELALLHTNEGGEGVYRDAICQQAQDVARQLSKLQKTLAALTPGDK
jgi:hypothetical protein